MRISVYLTFNGNCREAMEFYQSCLGGTLSFQTVGDAPFSADLPARMRHSILHSSLVNQYLTLSGSDMVPDDGYRPGNSVSLLLQCQSEEELRNCYSKLADGGRETHPLEKTFWGDLFGNLKDKYGHHWLLQCKEEMIKPHSSFKSIL